MERDQTNDRRARVIPIDRGIELRPVQPEDADALFWAIERNRERLRQWLPWIGPSYSLDGTRQFLAQREIENAAGSALAMAIWSEGEILGTISLHCVDRSHRSTSIGYWLDGAREGRGIMTRACRAMVTEGFQSYGLHRIEIRCATGNVRSGAIPKRLGFTEEGVLREAEWLYDHWVDLRLFSMLETDWKNR